MIDVEVVNPARYPGTGTPVTMVHLVLQYCLQAKRWQSSWWKLSRNALAHGRKKARYERKRTLVMKYPYRPTWHGGGQWVSGARGDAGSCY